MKKSILLLAFLFACVVSQAQTKPTYTITPKQFTPGNHLMVGGYDTATSSYIDSLLFVIQNNNPQIWGKTKIEFFSPLDANSYINTDSSIYIKGYDLIRHNPSLYANCFGYYAGLNNIGDYFNGFGHRAGFMNTKGYFSGFGHFSGYENTGEYFSGFGSYSGYQNTGKYFMGFGVNAGFNNTLDSVLYIGSGDTNTALIYGRNLLHKERVRLNGNTYVKGDLSITGDLTYNYRHAVGSADSISYSTGTTQNYYYKINTGAFTWRESDGITTAGDSLTITMAGDYTFEIFINATTSNANDIMRCKMYINNASSPTSLGRFVMISHGTGAAPCQHYKWYRTCSVGDRISFRIANQSGARACVITDFKLLIEKKPE